MTEDSLFGDSVYESGEAIEDAENLDPVENLTGDDPDEIMQTGYNPPDREPHNLRAGLTPAEERDGPSLEDRLAQEEPDISADDLALTEPSARAGRLVAPGEGGLLAPETDMIADDVGPAGYASSAEEAAMHIVTEDAAFDD
ncbi:MAG: hypothetical protein JWM76_1273 [Pseudonocardiales bacterium]|nr:hypothetical protein [Pseudonocardiales bacterium]